MKKFVIILSALLLCGSAFAQEEQPKKEFGFKQTGRMSTPKVGGYIIGGYKYNDQEGKNGGPGFTCRLIRLYVDGSIFNDFKYRIQFQANGEKPHVKDFYVEWARWKEFSVKLGQFKRAFTFENPMNPWDVGVGDFSFLVQKFAGMGDRLGEANMGGRDLGIQVQGDLFPIGEKQYRLVHYQLGLYNGQGINLADANRQKDIIGTIQFQPIQGLYVGAFGWMGSWHNATTGDDLKRERISAGLKFDRNNWTVRGEWATALAGEKEQSGAADAFYVTVGVPVLDWLKIYAKWDEFRANGTADSSHDMYSAAANFRLHKNLNFQLEYRYHNDKLLAAPQYNELWFLAYIRF
ncbi:MAG: porin [Bacteroidales bacterium]|nr:porin [Bacteroidales bacterium]